MSPQNRSFPYLLFLVFFWYFFIFSKVPVVLTLCEFKRCSVTLLSLQRCSLLGLPSSFASFITFLPLTNRFHWFIKPTLLSAEASCQRSMGFYEERWRKYILDSSIGRMTHVCNLKLPCWDSAVHVWKGFLFMVRTWPLAWSLSFNNRQLNDPNKSLSQYDDKYAITIKSNYSELMLKGVESLCLNQSLRVGCHTHHRQQKTNYTFCHPRDK